VPLGLCGKEKNYVVAYYGEILEYKKAHDYLTTGFFYLF
jgi:hypothetical protein